MVSGRWIYCWQISVSGSLGLQTLPGKSGGTTGRNISAAVKREVARRDGGRCTFLGQNGKRCGERKHLEYHHKVPFARGGVHTVENIELLCRTHNQHQAVLDFGLESHG